jgi:hypothetical protein
MSSTFWTVLDSVLTFTGWIFGIGNSITVVFKFLDGQPKV